MQTAVDFLFKRLSHYFPKMEKSYNPLYKQAKEIERQAMIDFSNDLIAQNDRNYIGVPNLAEQYYNETYESKGSDETKTN